MGLQPTSAILHEMAVEVPLPQPTELRLTDKLGKTTLTVKYAQAQLGNRTVFVRTYNGQLVGPTIRARPGDTLFIELVNQLPEDPSDPPGPHGAHGAPPPTQGSHDINIPHGFNVTNLHTHGLHVRPDYPSRCKGQASTCGAVADNVLVEIPPGQSQAYEIEIPRNHPPGTHWYHAHKHGGVAMQLASGMAGALIIEGGLDEVPEFKKAREQLLLFQQLSLSTCGRKQVAQGAGPASCQKKDGSGVVRYYESCDAYFQRLVDEGKLPSFPKGAACVESFDLSFGPDQWGSILQPVFGDRTTINGQLVPVITLRQGELQRWRMLHGGIRETLMLGLVAKSQEATQRSAAALVQGSSQRLPFQVIAHDGITTGRMDAVGEIELQPGYRVDALVRIDQPGEYKLIDIPTPARISLRGVAEEFEVLATVRVLPSDAPPMALPGVAALATLAPYKHVEDKEVTGCQYNTFNIDTQSNPPRFVVNGQPYSSHAAPRTMPLGKAEEWVANSLLINHPYHIHINPFELVDGYDGLPKGTWKDTLLIKQDTPVRFRTRYTDFTGKFVLHCHILDHEDQGMMQLVEILPKGVTPTSCPTLKQPGAGLCALPPPPDGACNTAGSASR